MMNHLIDTISVALQILPAKPYCLPTDAATAIDTFKFWAGIVAGAAAVVALIFIGIGLFASHHRGGDGGQLMNKLGLWILGAVLVTAASGLAAVFVHIPTDCVPMPA